MLYVCHQRKINTIFQLVNLLMVHFNQELKHSLYATPPCLVMSLTWHVWVMVVGVTIQTAKVNICKFRFQYLFSFILSKSSKILKREEFIFALIHAFVYIKCVCKPINLCVHRCNYCACSMDKSIKNTVHKSMFFMQTLNRMIYLSIHMCDGY